MKKIIILGIIFGLVLLSWGVINFYGYGTNEYKMTGVIQAVSDGRPLDGILKIMINDRWIIIDGSPDISDDHNGVIIGANLKNINRKIIGKTVEVYAKKVDYSNDLSILEGSKYYLKIIQ